MHGMCKWYYESGTLKTEGNWIDGIQDGICRWYYENGKLKAEANFTDGKLFSSNCYGENGNKIQCSPK